MELKEQKAYLEKIEISIGVNSRYMAEMMAIPYDSYKDLKSGRRRLRDIHIRLLDLIKAVSTGKVSKETAKIDRMRKRFEKEVDAGTARPIAA